MHDRIILTIDVEGWSTYARLTRRNYRTGELLREHPPIEAHGSEAWHIGIDVLWQLITQDVEDARLEWLGPEG